MRFPSKEIVENLKRQYPIDTRVELVSINDVQAPPAGTIGTVKFVDDAGTIHVAWDNGSSLGIAYGEDICKDLNKF